MDTVDSIWSVAIVCMVGLYLCGVILAIRHLWNHRRDCLDCAIRQAWFRSVLLAFLVTLGLVGDLWLFAVPGPAALGFAILFPGVLFADGHRLEVLVMISIIYVLPWAICTAFIFFVWRFFRWWRLSRW